MERLWVEPGAEGRAWSCHQEIPNFRGANYQDAGNHFFFFLCGGGDLLEYSSSGLLCNGTVLIFFFWFVFGP